MKNESSESILYHSTLQSMVRLHYTYLVLFLSTCCLFYRYTDPIIVPSHLDDGMNTIIDIFKERIFFCQLITGIVCGIEKVDKEEIVEKKEENKKITHSIKKYNCKITSNFWSSIIKCIDDMGKIKDYKKQAYYAVEVIVYDRKILKDSTITIQKGNIRGIVTTLYN